jgi:hypothetical protein
MKTNKTMLLLIGATILGAILIGCNKTPFETATGGPAILSAVAGGPVQFSARVATMDQLQRKLTFEGRSDTVTANLNCEVVRLQNGAETPAQLGDVKCGDSLQVFGERRQDKNVSAYRLRICDDSENGNQISARVRTLDQRHNMLTFIGRADTVVPNPACQIVRSQNGGEAQVMIWQINFGDSVEVFGQRNQNGYLDASRIKICGDKTGCQYDVSFRDTIAAIDYATGTFAVKNRTETIMIDASTMIYGVIVRVFEPPTPGELRQQQQGTALSVGKGCRVVTRDSALSLTDLAVGDVIEVRAKTIDASTLLAVSITLAACNSIEKKCVVFDAYLASVDAVARIVTFEGLATVGAVCNGAKLTGLSGEILTLSDFAVGEYVSVKGFPLEDGTLKISEMTKTTP